MTFNLPSAIQQIGNDIRDIQAIENVKTFHVTDGTAQSEFLLSSTPTSDISVVVTRGDGQTVYTFSDLTVSGNSVTLPEPAHSPASVSFIYASTRVQQTSTMFTTPYEYGARGGGLDDADAVEAALNSGKVVEFAEIFRSSRPLNVSSLVAISRNPGTCGIVFDATVETGIFYSDMNASDLSYCNIGLFTKAVGAGIALKVDFNELDVSQFYSIASMPRQIERLTLDRTIIGGEFMNFASFGWQVGLEIDYPYSVRVKDSAIFGYVHPTARDVGDFVADSIGIHVPVTVGTGADMKVSNTKIFGFMHAAIINNVEAITFDSRCDVQLCYNGLFFDNPSLIRNQINVLNCHIVCSNTNVSIEDARQIMLQGNQFDYGQGSLEVRDVSMLKLSGTFYGHVQNNVFRAGSRGSITVHCIEMGSSTVTGVRDYTISGNRYQDVDYIYKFTGDLAEIARITAYGNQERDALNVATPDTGGFPIFIPPMEG